MEAMVTAEEARSESRGESISREEIEAYQVFFEFIGRTLTLFPSRDLFAVLVEQDAFGNLPLEVEDEKFMQGNALLSAWSQSLSGVMSEETYRELLVDNTRLFSGYQEMACPPWESFYFNRERMIFQKETSEVRRWYHAYGLQSTKIHHEPDDHIGLELMFIARLLARALEEQRSDSAAFAATLSDAYRFSTQHPMTWAALWASRVEEQAKTGLYQGIAQIIPPALETLCKQLEPFKGAFSSRSLWVN